MALSSRYHKLFNRLLQGRLSPKEADELACMLGSDDPAVETLVTEHLGKPHSDEPVSPEIMAALDARLPAIFAQNKTQAVQRLPYAKRPWVKYAAAAILVLLAALAWSLMNRKTTTPQLVMHQPVSQTKNNDVAPGKQGAILTLDNGRRIVLDSLGNGVVATQNGANILLSNGQLTYDKTGNAAATVTYNTMTTPRGRQFQLQLPDGTRAWLDAASSLRFPTIFTGSERSVEITGEVYFEVAKNAAMPFKVKVKDYPTEIEVLGTHFNINAYPNEASVNTTLLEGSVKISNGNANAVLTPGQQAQVATAHPQSGIKVVSNVNVNKVTAWKDGVFDFEDASLEEVVKQLERWYDIEVSFEKNIPKIEFIGKIGRDLTLAAVLEGLKMSEVHFRIEQNRRLVVTP